MLTNINGIVITVAPEFVINSFCGDATQHTWLSLLDEVLVARISEDPANVNPAIWKAFVLFAFVLIPCVQSW